MQVTVDDAVVFVHTGGGELEGSGRLVLLLHGAGNDHTIWRYATRRLAATGGRVAAPDLPAHGRSEGPALVSVRDMSTWALHLADAVGATQLAVAGHSLGSLVAMEVAIQAPERVEAVVLVGTAAQMKVHADLQAAADAQDRLATDLIVGWTHSGRSRFGHHESPGVWMAGSNRRLLERNAGSLGIDLTASATWDRSGDFAKVGVPTLVVVGERDRMAAAAAGRKLQALLPTAELVEVRGGSHASLYDHPREVVEPVVDWLGRTVAARD